MFGPAYEREMSLEIFLRYLDDGIQNLMDIRRKLYFISDKEFSHVLKTAVERNLVFINKKNKTIFMCRKIFNIIRFIEKYNFIEELQKYELDNEHKFTIELNKILEKTNFYNKNYRDISTELTNCMHLEENEDYSTEIMNFRFYIRTKKKEKSNDLVIDCFEDKGDIDNE